MIYVGPKKAPKSYLPFVPFSFKREIVEMNSFWAHGMMLEVTKLAFVHADFHLMKKIGPFARLKAENKNFMANPLGARNKGLIAGLIMGNPSLISP